MATNIKLDRQTALPSNTPSRSLRVSDLQEASTMSCQGSRISYISPEIVQWKCRKVVLIQKRIRKHSYHSGGFNDCPTKICRVDLKITDLRTSRHLLRPGREKTAKSSVAAVAPPQMSWFHMVPWISRGPGESAGIPVLPFGDGVSVGLGPVVCPTI